MKKLLVGALIGAVAMSGLVGIGPAHADPGAWALVVQGSGAIDPGLTLTPVVIQGQTWHWEGVAEAIGAPVAGPSSCGAAGAGSINDTIATAVGQGGWGCWWGPLHGRSGQLTYVRVGVYLHIVLTGTLNGTLACVIEYHEQPPQTMTGFTITCAGAAVGL
jgi:hypothetical protein